MQKERTIKGILGTDIYISINTSKLPEDNVTNDIDFAISEIRRFEKKFSRFIPGNFLDEFNKSSEFETDQELVELLHQCKKFYSYTNGLFNPAIYPVLLNEGYNSSIEKGLFSSNNFSNNQDYDIDFNKVEINQKKITKPSNLRIEFGGIGKGYLVEKLRKIFSQRYENFCIDLGGDMYLGGVDEGKGYPYWAIEIEPPEKDIVNTPTLLLSNISTATSGVNKRKWKKEGTDKNHLINSVQTASVQTEILCSTVINSDPVYADVMAKTLLLMGSIDGLKFAELNGIPLIYIFSNGQIVKSKNADKYIWS